MITKQGILEISDPSIKYISEWRDNYGNCCIDSYIRYGRFLLNKQVTGCGCTSYYLVNNENIILLSPRVKLLRDKHSKLKGIFYYNREIDETTNKSYFTINHLIYELGRYLNSCKSNNKPVKLLCTYDSFNNLAEILENNYHVNMNNLRIVIDECHSIIRDVKLKQCRNKKTLSDFLARVFKYENLLFVSATPMMDFLEKIKEFQDNDVYYYEMKWACAREIERFDYKCSDSKDAFDQIYKDYRSHVDSIGRNIFDARYHADGTADYSYEAVIFLNDVKDIVRILKYYIKDKNLIAPSDVTVFCAETKKNRQLLKSVNKSMDYATRIPQAGKPHTTWTFVTSTCFWGVDFNSQCASTFVIANYYIPSLSLDIASDIPQIIGRQRLESNAFRNTMHIFFTNAVNAIDDAEFKRIRDSRMENSIKQIELYEGSADHLKDMALSNLNHEIDRDPNDLYVTTVSGSPEIDPLLIIAEDFSRYIITNHNNWFIGDRSNAALIRFNGVTENLKNELLIINGDKKTEDRIRKVYDYFVLYNNDSNQIEEFYKMLHTEGYGDIASYFSNLSLQRIYANGFNTTKMDNEIAFIRKGKDIADLVKERFETGKTYSKKEVKDGLRQIYESLGLKPKGTASDLKNYCDCEEVRVNSSSNRVYRIK